MSAPRQAKRLAAEALFRQGITSPIKVAKAIDYSDSANVRKWLVAWCEENGVPYPSMRKGRKKKPTPDGARVREARHRLNSQQGSSGSGGLAASADVAPNGADQPTSTLPAWLDELPISLPWFADEGASVEDQQRSFVLRARLRRLPLRDAYKAAGVPRHVSDSWNDDQTPHVSGLMWSEEIEMAAALGLLGHVEAIAQFAERYPSNPKSVDLRSWLLERTAPDFVRRTAVAVGVSENVYIRDERTGSPAAILEGLAEIERRFNAARIVPQLPKAASDEVIDVESREVEDDEDAS